MNRVAAVLLGGGTGDRVGASLPKQFLDLGGKPLLLHSLEALRSCPRIDAVVVVLPATRPPRIDEELSAASVIAVVDGGPTRQASLVEGLSALPSENEVVVVHDAARPLVTPAIIVRVLEVVGGRVHGAVPALAVDEALKEVSSTSEILGSRSRAGLRRAQTPQAFLRDALEDSLARADAEGVVCEDCSEMLTRAGYKVLAVEGDPMNLKVTYPEDLAICEAILSAGRGTA